MKQNKKYLVVTLFFIILFSLVPLTGDDWGQQAGNLYESVISALHLWKTYNGRFFGSLLVSLINNYPLFRIILQSVVVSALIFFLSIFEKNKKINFFYLSILLIIGMPFGMFRESLTWMSGFANFAIPALAILIYLFIIRNMFDLKKELSSHWTTIVFCFSCGIFMNMFSEHSSVFSVVLGLGTLLITFLIRKKVYKVNIAFLIGASIGCFLTFASPVYWDIMPRLANAKAFNNLSIIGKAIYNIKEYDFLKNMVFENIILNIFITIIFISNAKNNKNILNKTFPFLMLFLTILVFPLITINKITVLNNVVFEILLAALYISIIVILLFINFYKKDFFYFLKLICIYLSSFIVALPLLFVYQIGPRCFFNSYILLCIFTISLCDKLLKNHFRLINHSLLIINILISSSLLFMYIQNYKVLKEREKIIKEEISKTIIDLPRYPYPFLIHQKGSPKYFGYHYLVFKDYYNIPNDTNIVFGNDNKYLGVDEDSEDSVFLTIPTYDGSNQPTHPSTIHFNKKVNGYYFWMAFTPWPNNQNKYENPSIVVSNDGVNWEVPQGLTNPIVLDPPALSYYSDPCLVYINNQFELWYRYNPYEYNGEVSMTDNNLIYRKTSKDGISWSEEELIFDDEKSQNYMSISVIYDDNLYKVWYVNYDSYIYYKESSDLVTWTNPKKVTLENYQGKVWHGEVKKTTKGYDLIFLNSDNDTLNYAFSDNGVVFSKIHEINIKLDYKNTTSARIYKSSYVIVGSDIYLYVPYNTINKLSTWKMYLQIEDTSEFYSE